MARLQRTLSLGSVVLFGIAYMTPIIVLGTFGILAQSTAGMVPAAYLAALVAMFFTAMRYGRMAAAFPVAGSAYSYVRKAISETRVHRRLGRVARLPVPADGDLADRRRLPQLRVPGGAAVDLGVGVYRHHQRDQHRRPEAGQRHQRLADAGASAGADCLRRAVYPLHWRRCEHTAMDGQTILQRRHANAADHERRSHRLLLIPRL